MLRSVSRPVIAPIALAALAVALPLVVAASDSTRFSAQARPFVPALAPVASVVPPTTRVLTPTTRPITPATRVAGEAIVPSAIDATGTTDVTKVLNAFVSHVADGSTIVFPRNGRFRIEGTLLVKNHKHLTINGRGAMFFAKSNGAIQPLRGCNQQSSACRYPNRTRSQWSLESDTSLVVRSVNVVGSNLDSGPNGIYKGDLEAQHGFQILGGRDILLDHVSAQNVWGDLVNIGAAPTGSMRSPTNVTVQNSSFYGASRQGWSITNGQHVTFANNTLTSVRRSLIDVEANASSDQIAFVTIRDNQLGSYRFCTFTNFGAPANEHDFVFSGNRSIGTAPIKICGQARASARRRNFQITDNVGAIGSANSNEPMVSLTFFDNVVVRGNVQRFAASWPTRGGVNGSPQAPVTWTCTTGVVTGNTFTPRPATMQESQAKPC
jgi:hypothetical protein